MRPWIAYTLVRIGLFAALFALLALAGLELWLAAVLAAVLGLLVSYIFLRGLRARFAGEIAESRTRTRTSTSDEDAEDSASAG